MKLNKLLEAVNKKESTDLKYELIDEQHSIGSWERRSYRIRALKKFGNVKVGDLGGYVESEKNLSQDGDCWIYSNAACVENARVFENAKLFGGLVDGSSKVYGNAKVYMNGQVNQNGRVYGNAKIGVGGRVAGNAQVYDEARVYGNAWVAGNAKVSGKSKIHLNAFIEDNKEYKDVHVTKDNIIQED